jgi:hypothetical protein
MQATIKNILVLLILLTSLIHPQQFFEGSPEWLVDMFFSKSSFPDKANYFSGEMLDESNKPTIGEELNGKGEISFHQIKATNDENVYAVEVKLEDKVIDFYCYLQKQNNVWKIFAVRRFILPDFVFQVADSLSQLPSLADSSLYLSLKLFIQNDAQLKEFFVGNSDAFNKLINYFNQDDKAEGDRMLAKLGLNAIFRDKNFPGCIFLLINSFQSIVAGFIYAADSAKLPEISASDLIYLEEIIPGWFVFRSI